MAEADRLGWLRDGAGDGVRRTKKGTSRGLGDTLAVMLEECDPRLPPGFVSVNTLGKHLAAHPRRDALLEQLRAQGCAAARWVTVA
jgi:hypothetical protein